MTGFVAKSVLMLAVADGWVVNASLFFAPGTSVSVPRLVTSFVTPEIESVPLFVMLPEASGAPADGRTRTSCQVSEFRVCPCVEAVIVTVIVDAVRVVAIVDPLGKSLKLFAEFAQLAVQVTRTVGAIPPVSNTKPVGAFKIIVPVFISLPAFSAMTGPVSAVYVPPVVSAEIADPPVVGVSVTAAKTTEIVTKIAAMTNGTIATLVNNPRRYRCM